MDPQCSGLLKKLHRGVFCVTSHHVDKTLFPSYVCRGVDLRVHTLTHCRFVSVVVSPNCMLKKIFWAHLENKILRLLLILYLPLMMDWLGYNSRVSWWSSLFLKHLLRNLRDHRLRMLLSQRGYLGSFNPSRCWKSPRSVFNDPSFLILTHKS